MKKTIDDSWLTTAKSEAEFGPLERDMYRDHRRELLTWMLNEGKAPDAKIGYAKETVKNRAHRLDLFYRWV